MKFFAHAALTSLLAISTSGCGTAVPSLQEFPSAPGDEQLLVQAIIASIHCEVANAVVEFIEADKLNAANNRGKRSGAWLDGWGAQVSLTLTINEKTSANPTGVWTPPASGNSIFTLGAGVAGSATAIRTSKANFFYTVKQLYREKQPGKNTVCTAGIQPSRGAPSLLVRNDLKLGDWLFDQLASSANNEVTFPVSSEGNWGQNVLSQEISFQVVTSGNVTPAWQLVRANFNQSGPFLEASRDRTSDLLVTFGPLDPKQDNKGLIPQAENIHFAQQLGLAQMNRPTVNVSIFP
ncbi:hypothetical protein EHH54_13155 [Rhizobium leguminosarum]|uniref:hypothetical protein n=1 Tax=Rhizobium leguminosarum TaxID=384 RepID=UPI000FEC69C4|nr:hypothetical protein [Rhizobium leguminosarum]RWX40279.1 hypothetical protein EHH54_13155 [Rhizobium leguminosarum]